MNLSTVEPWLSETDESEMLFWIIHDFGSYVHLHFTKNKIKTKSVMTISSVYLVHLIFKQDKFTYIVLVNPFLLLHCIMKMELYDIRTITFDAIFFKK